MAILNEIASFWWLWFVPAVVQASVIIAALAIVDSFLRRRVWPQIRLALWVMAAVKIILPPTFAMPTSLTTPIVERVAQQPEVSMLGRLLGGIPLVPVAPWTPPGETAAITLATGVFLVWLIGVALCGLFIMRRTAAVRRTLVAESESDVPSWILTILQSAEQQLGYGHRVQLRISPRLTSPAVMGAFKPTIILPREVVERKDTREVEHMLLHELAHVKRRDLLFHAIALGIQTLQWFNPFVWLLRRRLIETIELCCDATVAARLEARSMDYRETLLRLVGRTQGLAQPHPATLAFFGHSGQVIDRLDWLTRGSGRRLKQKNAVAAVVGGVFAMTVLPMNESRMPCEFEVIDVAPVTVPVTAGESTGM